MKLTPFILAIAILLLALQGPAVKLAGLEEHPELLSDPFYWRDVAASALSTVGNAYQGIVTVIAAALGIPLLRPGKPPTE